jgi:hypothetical protein
VIGVSCVVEGLVQVGEVGIDGDAGWLIAASRAGVFGVEGQAADVGEGIGAALRGGARFADDGGAAVGGLFGPGGLCGAEVLDGGDDGRAVGRVELESADQHAGAVGGVREAALFVGCGVETVVGVGVDGSEEVLCGACGFAGVELLGVSGEEGVDGLGGGDVLSGGGGLGLLGVRVGGVVL